MSDGFDVYSKVVLFGITGPPSAVGVPNMLDGSNRTISNYWYSAETLRSKSEPKAIFAVNTAATGLTYNAYSYGSPMTGVTNYCRFSENVQGGLTALAAFNVNRWYNYDSTHPAGTSRFSPIRMPDGSTNGVRLIVGGAGVTQGGLYHPLGVQSPGIFVKGKMYTASVWACGDSGGGVYSENPKFRIAYYTNAPANSSILSEEFTLTPVPTRYSFTFVSSTTTSDDQENIAFSCGYKTTSSQIVLWGAQVCDGNTANNYIPTSTEWNGVVAPIGAGTVSGPLSGKPSADAYNIDVTTLRIAPQQSQIVNIAPFAISNDVDTGYTPPTTFSVYGLY
jgi:hypothetical protein